MFNKYLKFGDRRSNKYQNQVNYGVKVEEYIRKLKIIKMHPNVLDMPLILPLNMEIPFLNNLKFCSLKVNFVK
jgi:hypothetical protein